MHIQFAVSGHIVTYTWGWRGGDPLYRRVHKFIMVQFQETLGSYRNINSPLEMRPTEMFICVTTWLNSHSYTVFSVLLGVGAFLRLSSVLDGSYETVVLENYWPRM